MDSVQQAVITYLESVMGIVVSRYSSGHFVLCCPFHDESTPSFHVYPDGHAHCYGHGCRFHGRLPDLIMRHEGLSIGQAFARIRELNLDTPLAVPVPRATRSPLPNEDERLAMGVAMELFFETWHDQKAGRPGRDYIFGARHITGPFSAALRIGYAPSRYTPSLRPRMKKVFGDRWMDLARKVGLLNERGYELMAGRVIFPCYDAEGLVWYQGRTINGGKPKCLNPAFRKHFYVPLPYADTGCTYVVEGPVDALSVATWGYHAVSLNGSGVPTIAEIKKWPAPILGAFDRDDAGAAYRKDMRALCERAGVEYADIQVPGVANDLNDALVEMDAQEFARAIRPGAMVAA